MRTDLPVQTTHVTHGTNRTPRGTAAQANWRSGLGRGHRRRAWVIAGWVSVAGVIGWGLRPEPAPAGVPPELVRLAAQLQVKDSLYHRTVGRWATEHAPGLAHRFGRLLGVTSTAPRQRLEACHALVALGPGSRPVLRQIVEAFCDPDHDVRVYAFIVLVHGGVAAAEVVARVRDYSRDPAVQARHCAGLLADEDEEVRGYAWACLDAFGPEVVEARKVLENLAAQSYDAELAGRARQMLKRPAFEDLSRREIR